MGKGNRTRNNKYQDTYDMSGSGAAVKSAKAPQKKDHTTTIVLIAIVALLAIALAFVIFADTGIKDRNTVVVSSDSYEVTGTMIPYYENLAYSNMFSQYFSLYYSYLGDVNTAYQYAAQMMSGYTLDDFFDSALATAKEIVVLCEEAKANGLALDADDEASIKETLESYEGNFSGIFGNGVKEKDVRKALELEALAGKYYDKFYEDKTEAVTDEDISKYIEENKADFYASHYLKFDITLSADDYVDLEALFEEEKALADKYVTLIANAKTESEFKNQIIRYIVDRDFDAASMFELPEETLDDETALEAVKQTVISTLLTVLVDEKEAEDITDSAIAAVYDTLEETCSDVLDDLAGEQAYVADAESDEIKWLVNDASLAYSTKSVDNSTDEEYSHSVYMLTEPLHLEDSETVNVGHILVEAREGTATEEDLTAAEKEAQEILNTYLSGDKTKEAFEALAEEKTDDSGVFYDNVAKGEMVEEFENWIFSEDRKEVGETGIVKTEFGYHVMYWNGKGENTSVTTAKEGIVSEQYQTFVEEAAKSLKINEKYVAKHTAETEAAA